MDEELYKSIQNTTVSHINVILHYRDRVSDMKIIEIFLAVLHYNISYLT